MTRPKAQRGSLLSSIVMVMLATVATGMLAFIGFQALPDSVIPATFGGNERSSRHVNVSDSPSPQGGKPAVVPSTNPPFPSATANPQATSKSTREPKPVRTGSTVTTTTAPKPVTTTTAPKPVTTTSAPKPTPSASASTQTASPAPTCGTGRKPRCPRAPSAEASPSYSGTAYSENSYTATRTSSAKHAKAPKARKHFGR